MMPKSSAVRTMPVPKISCQRRFTVTRAVSGFSGETSHCASPRRFGGASSGIGWSAEKTAGADFLARLIVLAAEEDVRDRLRVRLLLLDQRDRVPLLDRFLLGLQANGEGEAAAVAGSLFAK